MSGARYVWAVTAVVVMWAAVALVDLQGPDLEMESGATLVAIPTVWAVALLVTIATWRVAEAVVESTFFGALAAIVAMWGAVIVVGIWGSDLRVDDASFRLDVPSVWAVALLATFATWRVAGGAVRALRQAPAVELLQRDDR